MQVVLTNRTSKSCVVAVVSGCAHTRIFGRHQRFYHFFIVFQEGYMAYPGAENLSRSFFFFPVPPKVLNKVVVGSGQNKNLLWECDHWTKVRLRRDNSPVCGNPVRTFWKPGANDSVHCGKLTLCCRFEVNLVTLSFRVRTLWAAFPLPSFVRRSGGR